MKKQHSRRLALRLGLDLVMALALLALFGGKHGTGLVIHEIAGLALAGALAAHLLLNAGWISGASRGVFRGGASPRLLLSWIVDLLALVCFAAILISGVLISRVVFSFNLGGVWKTVHSFASACLLILMGVHLGLHAPLLAALCRRHGLDRPALRIAGGVLAAALVAFGCWSMATTSFTRWLTMPFASVQTSGESEHSSAPDVPGGTTADARTGATPEAASALLPASEEKGETAVMGDAERSEHRGQEHGAGQGNGAGKNGGFGGGAGMGRASLGETLWVMARYFSIIFVFAAATGAVEGGVRMRKKAAARKSGGI